VERLTAEAPVAGLTLARQRKLTLAVLLALAAAGWAVIIAQARGGHAMHDMMGPDLTMGGSAALFLAMWIAMMVAMMFPAAAPMILTYARMQRGERFTTTLFTAGYLALWIGVGGVALGLGLAAEAAIERSAWAAENWPRLGGLLLVLAGLYQLSPLKDYCLAKCRSPLSFLLRSWRAGRTGALRMGFAHGLYCVGCCWLLFLILIPLGVMNVAVMLVVAIVVFAEKTLPRGRAVGRVAAAALVVAGLLAAVRPELLPTVA
jgi:predicted metal-binding membrane protein